MPFLGFLFGKNKDKGLSPRQEFKLEKEKLKYEYKNNLVENKWDAYETAYTNGIDPKQSMWDSLSSMTGSLGGAASSIFGQSGSLFSSAGTNVLNGGKGGGNKFFLYGAIAFVLYLIFKK